MANACFPTGLPLLRRLTKHPCSHLRYTPESYSWSSRAKGCSRRIRQTRMRRGNIASAREPCAAIQETLAEHRRAPKRFVWTKRADMALATIEGCRGA